MGVPLLGGTGLRWGCREGGPEWDGLLSHGTARAPAPSTPLVLPTLWLPLVLRLCCCCIMQLSVPRHTPAWGLVLSPAALGRPQAKLPCPSSPSLPALCLPCGSPSRWPRRCEAWQGTGRGVLLGAVHWPGPGHVCAGRRGAAEAGGGGPRRGGAWGGGGGGRGGGGERGRGERHGRGARPTPPPPSATPVSLGGYDGSTGLRLLCSQGGAAGSFHLRGAWRSASPPSLTGGACVLVCAGGWGRGLVLGGGGEEQEQEELDLGQQAPLPLPQCWSQGFSPCE